MHDVHGQSLRAQGRSKLDADQPAADDDHCAAGFRGGNDSFRVGVRAQTVQAALVRRRVSGPHRAASSGQDQGVVGVPFAGRVADALLRSVDGNDTSSAMNLQAERGGFVFLEHAERLPSSVLGHDLGQADAIVKWQRLFAEHDNVVVGIVLPVRAYEGQSRGACSHDDDSFLCRMVTLDLHRSQFQIGLFRDRIPAGVGQVVGSGFLAIEDAPPVHGQENHAGLQLVADARAQPDMAVLACHNDKVAVGDVSTSGIVQVHVKARARLVTAQLGDFSRPGHGVPLVANAAGRQHQWKRGACSGGWVVVGNRVHLCAAAGAEKSAIAEKAGRTWMAGMRDRPLQRTFRAQTFVIKSADIDRGPLRERRVLAENVRHGLVVEPALPTHLVREANEDFSVGQRLARRLDHLRQIRNPALGIGHRPFFFQPTRRR